MNSPVVQIPVGAATGTASELEDPGITKLRRLEALNAMYCDILTENGMDGTQLFMKAPRRATVAAVTEKHSKERILALKSARTAGQVFCATGGPHLNTNEFFRARELARRDDEIKAKEKQKEAGTKLLADHPAQEGGADPRN